MYNINDMVVYLPCGVCRIDDITEKDFSGDPVKYYVLRPEGDSKSTFYVPVNSETLTAQMHKVITEEEINDLIRTMPDAADIWIEDEHQRKERYTQLLHEGNRSEIIKLIKTIYIHQQELREHKKKLRSADEHFLKDAENMLHEEFAYVLGIPKNQVLDYIKQHIN